MTTTITLPTTDVLRDIHRIARAKGLTVELRDLGISDPERVAAGTQAPYRWTFGVRGPDDRPMCSTAFERARELEQAIHWTWSNLVRWGLL